MPWRLQSEPTVAEKVSGGLSYFTFGVAGLIYQLFFCKGEQPSQQFRFHFFQAVILSILAMLVQMAVGPLLDIVMQIVSAVAPAALPPLVGGIAITGLIISKAFYLLLIYGAVLAFLGKFAEVPLISNIVRQNLR
jgi:uncharacterized membrane protein